MIRESIKQMYVDDTNPIYDQYNDTKYIHWLEGKLIDLMDKVATLNKVASSQPIILESKNKPQTIEEYEKNSVRGNNAYKE